MENFFAIFPHNGKNGGLRATFGPRSETELAFGNPCAKRALHTVENFLQLAWQLQFPQKLRLVQHPNAHLLRLLQLAASLGPRNDQMCGFAHGSR